ncbi:MAG: TRAP transporter small permease, partial [Rhodospirillum sp.]|nr:TRAP transporter small permease [Rhodospirillum sp.]
DALVSRVETAAGLLSGGALLVTMLLVSVDALMRYVLGSPIVFAHYVTENYMLPAMVLPALAWSYRTGGSIQIEALLLALPDWLGRLIHRLGLTVACLYMGRLTWLGWIKFQSVLIDGEVDMGVVDWPKSWSWVWVPLGCGLLCIRLALDALAPAPEDDEPEDDRAAGQKAETEEAPTP